ncbi:MAG TPA: pantoate--beta-alanine ligase [Candidatus Limnocylindria bacterium]|nr:pantoate--beta-alanine ligase [Candidatus Limnocylindria bacterium]
MTVPLRTVAELREWRARPGSVGLVPTMGALHAGHAALVERARRENERVLVSIFVNPTQFGPGEDYLAYPRTESADLALLGGLGADAAFLPDVSEVYPPGDATRVVPGPVAEPLEGARRPGHFTGVATVVMKLFLMTGPDRAYFGQKDFQQLRVLQTVARDLRSPVEIVPCPTVREPDGLALSSRNAYLGPDERRRATALSRGLFAAVDAHERGERDAGRLRAIVTGIASGAGALDYVSVADPATLRELEGAAPRAVISLACRVGRARLIDNVLVGMTLAELV